MAAPFEKTALLLCDFQNDIIENVPEDQRGPLIARTKKVLEAARAAKMPVVYIVVRFRPGYPEVCERNKFFSQIKGRQRLIEGTPGAEIHVDLAPTTDEVVVTKRRVGAFSTTDLESVLKSKNVEHIVLAGISVTGVILSTIRHASDLDYKISVISDCCADSANPEAASIIMEKVFPRQADVIDSAGFISRL